MSDRFQRAALHEAEGADDRIAMKARITGIVQGVGFRAWTAERARAHGLAGYVRNEADGSVTALFSGPQRAVEAMLSECRKGPPAAKVDDVSVDPSDEAPTGAFASY